MIVQKHTKQDHHKRNNNTRNRDLTKSECQIMSSQLKLPKDQTNQTGQSGKHFLVIHLCALLT